MFKAMNEADNNHKKLTAQERQRNKRTGDVYLYFVKNDKKSNLRKNILSEG